MKSILIIDDSPDFREIVTEILDDADYDVHAAACPEEAFELLETAEIDLIICDLHMPFTLSDRQKEFIQSNTVGIRTVKELGWVFPTKPIIVVSASTPRELREAVAEMGDVPILSKPFSPQLLLNTIQASMALRYFEVPQ